MSIEVCKEPRESMKIETTRIKDVGKGNITGIILKNLSLKLVV